MQISLRKANALQSAINEELKAGAFSTLVSISEFVPAEKTLATAKVDAENLILRQTKLLNALYSIRASVAKANHDSGITGYLTDIALLEKLTQIYTNMSKTPELVAIDIINAKLAKIKSAPASPYRSNDETVSTGIFDKATLGAYAVQAQEFKRQKVKLQDKILELNIQTKITLDEETVKTITVLNLL